MLHYIVELAILLFIAYFIGVLIGYLLRRTVGQDMQMEPAAAAKAEMPVARPVAEPVARPVAEPVAGPGARPVAKAAVPPPPVSPPVSPPVRVAAPLPAKSADVDKPKGKPQRPKGIAAARRGKADNLQRISGIGPKNEKVLQSLGFFHFDQIAAWTAGQVDWIDDHLKFNGRIRREEWIRQAGLLAEGKEQEFRKRYGTGGLTAKQGAPTSGSRTRKG